MAKRSNPIGVTDSGVGGLSVVSALRRRLPQEDILYYGDTANCPYGNKTREQLLELSSHMLRFLQERQVKCVALACNTTSSLADVLRSRFDLPIITVAECAAGAVKDAGLDSVGLIATVYTVASGIYDRCIRAVCPATEVVGVGSRNLAALVEDPATTTEQIDDEIRRCLDEMLARRQVKDVILGCTHYPLVLDRFQACYPGIRFLDPAPRQARTVDAFLEEHDLKNETRRARLTVYTTGDPQVFRNLCTEQGFGDTYEMEFHKIP